MANDFPRWAREQYKDPYDFERKTAERYAGGRREVASGAFSGRFDVNSEEFMIDNKRTGAKQYTVKLAHFQDIERKAREHGRLPMVQVNFDDPGVDLVVMRRVDFDYYYQMAKEAERAGAADSTGD